MDNNPEKKDNQENTNSNQSGEKKKKISLADFKVKSFVTQVKVEQMQFLKTAGG
jgi:hypothetical protein